MKLSREEILEMEPGRDLDIAVAVEIMGYTVDRHRQGLVSRGGNSTYPRRYSTDISAAWEVLTKMEKENQVTVYSDNNGKWACEIGFLVEDDCDEAPESICKAALLATLEANQ